jgi:hypothetical protein
MGYSVIPIRFAVARYFFHVKASRKKWNVKVTLVAKKNTFQRKNVFSGQTLACGRLQPADPLASGPSTAV